MLIKPSVAVRRRDPFVLAPAQEGVNDGMALAVGLEHPRARRGHIDANPGEEFLDIGRLAQVNAAARDVPQDGIVALATNGLNVGGIARPGTGVRGNQRLSDTAIDWETVAGEFQRQHGCRGFAVCRCNATRSELREELALSLRDICDGGE
jgi:hypothetical protein